MGLKIPYDANQYKFPLHVHFQKAIYLSPETRFAFYDYQEDTKKLEINKHFFMNSFQELFFTSNFFFEQLKHLCNQAN